LASGNEIYVCSSPSGERDLEDEGQDRGWGISLGETL
jgi:hypothetical protein